MTDATEEQIKLAANDTIPRVFPLFWSFRIMVGLGILFLFIFAATFYYSARRQIAEKPWLLKLAVVAIPLPWLVADGGSVASSTVRHRRGLVPGVGDGKCSGTCEDDDTGGHGQNDSSRHEKFPQQPQLDRTGALGCAVAPILAAQRAPDMSTRTQLRPE